MLKKKLTCPKCGSENAVRIIYGEPTFESLEASARGEICLGGCCLELNDPLYVCQDCAYRWGINVDSIDLMQSIEAHIGGYFASNICIEADMSLGRLKYSCVDYHNTENDVQLEKEISAEDWKKLIRGLKNCDFEYWLDKYEEAGVCDGTEWRVTVGLSNGEKLEKYGNNQYPNKWKQFCKALSKIAGARFK